MQTPVSVRHAALLVLHRIMIEHCKAAAAMDACHVHSSDRGLLHEMTYGVLRRWFSLEADMSRFCRAKPDDWTQLALLLGTYQIRHMRIPDHAAVGETVEAVKAIQPKSAGYVNAILRKVAAHPAPTKLKPNQKAKLPRLMYN